MQVFVKKCWSIQDQSFRNFDTLMRHFEQENFLLFDLATTAGLAEFITEEESAFSILNSELVAFCILHIVYIVYCIYLILHIVRHDRAYHFVHT